MTLAAGGAAASTASGATPTVLIEQTFLKAEPGRRADLARYIEANWFVLDRQGVARGIFTSFALYEDIDANADWDLMVAVGYPQPQGYDDPATQAVFKALKAAHVDVPIDGRSLAALGRIVRHHRLRLMVGG
ncbi:hypothetical protein IP88_13170 [alpha proteobacterium AAP81b]|nr:hypothetical protein IP88_13170 [alpha proteobacterium AAP81b]